MTVQKRVQQGFTLIELMIVIAIVGILAAIALPAYQDYTVRAKMSEPMAKLAESKTTIAEYFVTNSVVPATLAVAGIEGQESIIATEIVRDMTYDVNSGGPIVNIFVHASVLPGETNDLAFQLSGITRDDGSITWVCQPGDGASQATPMKTKWLPANCRG
ncbi:pilin [Parahaliea maris]|uniref:Pilin n=1 Tax=Parahaliea maris TaxID=2716870 RepID=A0A5C9A5W8_9GAMM|nr:pilin [Parahaliea maris]TXS96315.1 pilin [Parahaliea maris]